LRDRERCCLRFLVTLMDFLGEGSKRFGDVCDVNVIVGRSRWGGPNIVFHITLEGFEERVGKWALTSQILH
jgi:hypothetical protein